nr:unnamed protein product [Callosobruchus chinensis]
MVIIGVRSGFIHPIRAEKGNKEWSLAKQIFISSPIEAQEYVAARQFFECIADLDLDVQRTVSLSSPRTLQIALVKALQIEAASRATRMTRSVRSVKQPTSFTPRRGGGTFQGNPPVSTTLEGAEKFACWKCGQKGYFRVGCRIQVNNMKVDVRKSDEYANKMEFVQYSINSMKEQFNRDMKNQLKKNEESIDKLRRQHDAAMKKVTADRDMLKQLLDHQKRRSLDVKSKFDKDMMNLLKKNEQHEAALREFKEKHGKKAAAL